ncbi:MAG: 30S ribosome-binding factor RbfA [Planctomycetes bacterium]|nr:30S ribosome-binding factor RbfA [Planctomycetota bacterium]
MSQPYRREKLGSEIVRVTAEILGREMRDPRLGFVSITKAEVSADMRYAKIFVSVYGEEKRKKLSMAALRHATGFVQKELGRRIRMRSFPEVSFVLDESIDKAFKISKIIDEVAAERRAREGGKEEE